MVITPSASAPAAATTTAATSSAALAANKERLFRESSAGEKKPGEPERKKRRLQLRIDQDPSLKQILQSVVGTREHKFRDGLILEETVQELKSLWNKLDFVQGGVLKQINFQSVRGIDPLWEQLLEACDVDGDGNITPTEFIAGFVFEALEKPLSVNMAAGSSVTGFGVMKGVQAVLNQHLLDEVKIFKNKLGWK